MMGTSVRLDDGEIARLLNDGSTDANFADKFVGEEAVRQISEALANNVSKTRVFLDRNCIGADGAAALGDMLKANTSITHLSLEWNSIGTFEEGVQRLADGLEVNGTLSVLVLCNNHISAQGAKCLLRALRSNTALTKLDLRWNGVGNDGARAVRDILDTNRSLASVNLSGNKVDDWLMENIEAALSDRESGSLQKTALWDDLHVARDKAEQLEARLRRQAVEEEAHKNLDQEKEHKWQEDLVAVKEDSARRRCDFERQMEASAKQMAELEEQLLHERSRGSSAREKLAKETERRESVQAELDGTKQTLLETRRDLTRQVERLQDSLDVANEDRRITQSELERVRDVLEGEATSLKEELRVASAEVERSRRAATRASAEAEQATALLETARAEVTLVAERADEAVAGVARATRDGASALDDTRRMYEERLESCKSDCEARARAAEDRARAVEHERQRAEAARQAASKELARLQISIEERLSQNERRVLGEAQKQFDLELNELRERIDVVHKVRDSKEAQAREHLASLEALRLRSTGELRELGRELAAAGEELEKAREAARNNDGKASKLQTEAGVLQRTVEVLQQRVEEMDRDKRQASDLHSANTTKIQAQHTSELKEGDRWLAEARAGCSKAEDRAKDAEEQTTTLKQGHLQSLHALERSVGQALADSISCARQRLEVA